MKHTCGEQLYEMKHSCAIWAIVLIAHVFCKEINTNRAIESISDVLYIDGAAFRGRLGLHNQLAAVRLFQAVIAEPPPVPVPQKFHATDFSPGDVRWAPMADGAHKSSARALAEHGRLLLALWSTCSAQWQPAHSRLRVQRHLDVVISDFNRRCKRIEEDQQCSALATAKQYDSRAVELLRIKLGLLQYLKLFIVASNELSDDGLGPESAESIDGLHHFVWRARVDWQRLGPIVEGNGIDSEPALQPIPHVQDGLLSRQECLEVVNGLEKTVQGEQGEISLDVSDVMQTVEGNQVPPWLHKLIHMRRVAREVAERHFNQTLYHELTEFTVRPPGRGTGQRWHADNCDFVLIPGDAELCIPNDSHEAPWITHSALLYLTGREQGVDGGVLQLSGATDSPVAPQCGRIVTFLGGAEHAHAVSRISAGRRWSIALWFSESINMQREAFIYSDGVVRRDPIPGESYHQPKLMSGYDARGGDHTKFWHHYWRIDLLHNTLREVFMPIHVPKEEGDERNPDEAEEDE